MSEQHPGAGEPPAGQSQYPAYPTYPQDPQQPQPGGYPPPPAPPYGYPAYPPGQPQPQQPSKTMAIVALVLAVLPCGITWFVAVVLAIIVLVQVRKGVAAGKGMAIAALVISVLWMIATTVVVVFVANEVTKYDENRKAGEGTIYSSDLREGDCLVGNDEAGAVISTVEIIPCAKSHLGEVFAVFSINVADDASQDEIDKASFDGCKTRFVDYVGDDFRGPVPDVSVIRPKEDDVVLNDEVACVVFSPSETTGSIKDATS